MKISLVFFLISFTFILNDDMIKKLINEPEFKNKENILKTIGEHLFLKKYEPAFVAGILGNIFRDKDIGFFEKSNFDSNPEQKPEYLKIMDEKHEYRNKYSGKRITEVSLRNLGSLLETLKGKKWKGQFGLGCVQWRGNRAYALYKLYYSECGNCDTIPLEDATRSEAKMLTIELESSTYSYIYEEWKKENPNINTPKAAYNAGLLIANKYEGLEDNKKAKNRANIAEKMYNAMTN